MPENIFEQVSRLKLRFSTDKMGVLMVEDLWDLPLTSTTGRTNLNDIGMTLQKKLRDSDTATPLVPSETAAEKPGNANQLMFDIVKHIIDVRVAERSKARDAENRAALKQKIMGIISDQEDQQLKSKSVEELRAMLSGL